ncbi:gp57 [Burkholderia phage BcepB1A]|uniref:gp57 n=1 Tax=Burkholderia phage BcepB1A TaxID=279530 RepID=UPI00003779AA|nr:gp57 [Burkholderia phage BcepB1A]AAT37751.1 gp57 [Burkholderia phage BcepB1A]
MTPAQEAKEYASKHGLTITTNDRRYTIMYGWRVIAEVGGYPAALNAMKRYVELRKDDAPVKADGISDVDDSEQPAIMPDETPATVSGMIEDHEFGTVQTPLRAGHGSINDAGKIALGVDIETLQKKFAAPHSARGEYLDAWAGIPPLYVQQYGRIQRKPFAISMNGRLLPDRYATRTEAIREVRRLLSAPGATGAQYRASRISVECL